MLGRDHSCFSWWSLHSAEEPGLTHVTERGPPINYLMSVPRHDTEGSEGHKKKDSPLFSKNLPTVLSSIVELPMDMMSLKEGEFRIGSDVWIGAFLLHFVYISVVVFITWHSYLPTLWLSFLLGTLGLVYSTLSPHQLAQSLAHSINVY